MKKDCYFFYKYKLTSIRSYTNSYESTYTSDSVRYDYIIIITIAPLFWLNLLFYFYCLDYLPKIEC